MAFFLSASELTRGRGEISAAESAVSVDGARKPAEISAMVLESGDGALTRKIAVVIRIVDFMSLGLYVIDLKTSAYSKL